MMIMCKGLIILDFDGTLCDTRETIVRTLQMTMRRMGLELRDEATCASTIGLPLADGFHAMYPEMERGMFEACAVEYRKTFEENRKLLLPKVFPGVSETLRTLHGSGFQLSVASSRSRRSLMSFIEDFGFAELMSLVIGADDVKAHKPDPEPVMETLRRLSTAAADTLVVGDMPFDILMGKGAGAATCGVTYGNATEAQLRESGADFIISSFPQLLDLAWITERRSFRTAAGRARPS